MFNSDKKNQNKYSDIVYGKSPVLEVIENGDAQVNKIWISKTLNDKSVVNRIIDYAKEKKIPFHMVPAEKINTISNSKNNQGLALSISPVEYMSATDLIDHVISGSAEKNTSVILVAHETEDPHNIGAMVRTFVAGGGKGIILTGKSNIGINGTVVKTSAGAIFQTKFARATNCSQIIEKLKENGFWVVGTDLSEDAQNLFEIDFPDQIAIVVGNEHEGLGPLIKKNCDFVAKIPISEFVDSLNVSVAFGITLYEFLRQKNFK